MTVKEAMEMLSKYSPEDELIIMWWDYELVNSWEPLTKDEWSDVVNHEFEAAEERVFEAIMDSARIVHDARVEV